MIDLATFFADHTYRTVLAGTTVIGLVAGALGAFPYLRRQSLISDVISHSALPGTLGAFIVAVVVLGVDGRSMLGLIVGAVLAGTLAALLANHIPRISVIGVDAAMAIVLTLFFGAGMLLMRVITNGVFPGKGGIQDYLFGNASVMTRADLVTGAVVGALALLVMAMCWKEFAVRSFDPQYATVLGIGPRLVDTLLFATVVVATVIGLKAVGMVLMVALVVTPPAAARQWTRRLVPMVLLSGFIGALGSAAGTYLSIALGGIPTGPLVTLTLAGIFVVSLLAAPGRSVVARAVGRRRSRRRLLREIEASAGASTSGAR